MYKKGNVFEDSKETKGWFYGSFMPEGFAKDDRVEIKIDKLKKGYRNKDHYQKTATKIDIVWSGEAVWAVNGERVKLKSGDYIIIAPKVRVHIEEIISDEALVQTIKIPSIVNDKVILE